MYNFLSKNGQLIAFGLGGGIILIFLLIVMTGDKSFESLPLDNPDHYNTGIFDFGLWMTRILTIVTAILMLLLPLKGIIENPKSAMKGLVMLAGMAIIFVIGYAMAEPEGSLEVKKSMEQFNVSQGTGRIIGAMINTLTSLTIVGIVALFGFEIRNMFK
jgi:hypothetical protein